MSTLRRILRLFVQPTVTGAGGSGAAARPPDSSMAPTTEEAIIFDLQRVIAERSGGRLRAEQINATQNLFERGFIDSLRSAELLDHILQRYGLVVPESGLLGKDGTLEGLARLIMRSLTP